ncbi:expansin EXLX1 family cellulose-binding protein [Actinoplanes sp. CA-054009]
MTGRFRLLTPRWLAAGGAAVLAAVLGLALVFQNSGAACAAPPSTTASKGKATYFSLDGTLGNCSFPSAPADDLFVALGQHNQYSEGAACGTYIDVTGPKGSTRVKVIDSCPECPAGHLDLSLTAFKKIGVQSDGIIPITYKTVPNAAVPGPISVRVKEGSSQYWLSVLIDNHANRLASVKIAGSGGTFKSATHEDFNYWTLPSGAGNGPFKIKITDVYGNSVTVPNIKLTEGKTQKTSSKLVSSTSSAPVKKKAPVAEKATPSPTPSAARSSAAPSSAAPSSVAPSSAAALNDLLESAAVATAEPTTAPPAETAVDLAAGTASKCG